MLFLFFYVYIIFFLIILRVEMNSPLEPDFDGFDFPEKNNKIDTTEENKTGLPIIGMLIIYNCK